jgi:hypothetical protein
LACINGAAEDVDSSDAGGREALRAGGTESSSAEGVGVGGVGGKKAEA